MISYAYCCLPHFSPWPRFCCIPGMSSPCDVDAFVGRRRPVDAMFFIAHARCKGESSASMDADEDASVSTEQK